jgi:hypothetical protein
VTRQQCTWTIRWGTSAETTTRCDKIEHSIPEHEGPGLAEVPGQRIVWYAGDRREYQGDWPGYCDKLPLAPFEGGCTLPLGHPGRCAP